MRGAGAAAPPGTMAASAQAPAAALSAEQAKGEWGVSVGGSGDSGGLSDRHLRARVPQRCWRR